MSAPALPLLILGVRGQCGLGSPSKLVLVWSPSILLLPVMGNMVRLPFIWMMLLVALSLEVALSDSMSEVPAHQCVDYCMAELGSIACYG